MSADNGIYIAVFPNGERRIAHAFDSVVGELETHWYSPEEYLTAVVGIWGKSPVFKNSMAAYGYADKLLKEYGYTEYGICTLEMSVNFGEVKKESPRPDETHLALRSSPPPE